MARVGRGGRLHAIARGWGAIQLASRLAASTKRRAIYHPVQHDGEQARLGPHLPTKTRNPPASPMAPWRFCALCQRRPLADPSHAGGGNASAIYHGREHQAPRHARRKAPDDPDQPTPGDATAKAPADGNACVRPSELPSGAAKCGGVLSQMRDQECAKCGYCGVRECGMTKTRNQKSEAMSNAQMTNG